MGKIKSIFSTKNVLPLSAILFIILSLVLLNDYLTKTRITTKSSAQSSESLNNESVQSYIIELKKNPVSTVVESQTKNSAAAITQQSETYRAELNAEHNQVKQEIIKKLGLSTPEDLNSRIIFEYTESFNGLTMLLNPDQLEKIKTLAAVKKVYPDLTVQSSLNQSVPLIKADAVWNIKDKDGFNITGNGIKAAIIDTGVDYTHPDLGGTTINERPLKKITAKPLVLHDPTIPFLDNSYHPSINQLISLDENRVAYPSDNKIYIYNLTSNTTDIIDLPASSYPQRLLLRNNHLLYYGKDKDDNGTIYYYNLLEKTHKQVAITAYISPLTFTQNKFFYARSTDPMDGSKNQLFLYNTKTRIETPILANRKIIPYPRASGNLVLHEVGNRNSTCPKKVEIYDIKTKKTRDIFPPEIGPVFDFKGDQILYLNCNPQKPNRSFRKYYLYNIKTGQKEILRYPPIMTQDENESSEGNLVNITLKPDSTGYGLFGYLSEAFIENGLTYIMRPTSPKDLVVYDHAQKRYVRLNIYLYGWSYATEDNTMCFVSDDYNIYCHIYSPKQPYPEPTQIYNNKVVDGYDFVSRTKDARDDNGHGTHVADIFGGNGQPKGVAHSAQIVAYKVIDYDGFGKMSTVIKAIDTVVQTRTDSNPSNDIHVINMSLGANCKIYYGGYTKECGPDDPLSKAADNATLVGIVSVVSAGNSGTDAPSGTIQSPGTSRKSITVGGVDKEKKLYEKSSRGPVIWNNESLVKPDVVAPAVQICASRLDTIFRYLQCIDDKHVSFTGTSMASPHVAGLVALIKQVSPQLSAQQVKDIIMNSADSLNLDQNTQGKGLINSLKAINTANTSPSSP